MNASRISIFSQKWFQIKSDSELESRINEQIKSNRFYADKGYAVAPNQGFPALNKIKDGITRKDSTTAKLTKREISRDKTISKFRYIVGQYFGISHPHDNGQRAKILE